MSRITNEMAEQIAKAMTSEKLEAIKKLESEISEKTREEVLKTIPKEVKDFFKKFPEWTQRDGSVRLNGNGCDHERVRVETVPSKNNGTVYHNPSNEFASEILKLINKRDKLKNDLSTLKKSIENALKQLRTFKKIREAFPEAAEFLPKDNAPMLPCINLDVIRKNLL